MNALESYRDGPTFPQLGMRKLIEELLEAEVSERLGRGCYERGDGQPEGYRNGYRTGRLRTGEGEVEYQVPQVRGLEEPLRSKLRPELGKRTEALEDLAVEMYARGLSTRDIEATFCDEKGRSLLSRTAVSQVTERLWEEIEALSRNLTAYVSSNDRALPMSRVLNRERRLGESTLDPSNPDQYHETARAFESVEPDSDTVTLVDVTPMNRTRNFHNFSLETPEFVDDLYLRLLNEETPRSRLRYPARTPRGVAYWVLVRGR